MSGDFPERFRTDVLIIQETVNQIKKDFNNIDSLYGWTIYPLNSPANDFSKLHELIPVHTHENQIPLAGIQSPTDMVFRESYI